ncbi:hypothetical protein [uncultured Roseobacter sp.]|nr:hypothetical protein [uncultured Roseobacter sp.]
MRPPFLRTSRLIVDGGRVDALMIRVQHKLNSHNVSEALTKLVILCGPPE